jgi:serine/threonine protein kinase
VEQNIFCYICGAELANKPELRKPVKCLECGYQNAVAEAKRKSLQEQLADLTADLTSEDIEQALSTINIHLSQEILSSNNIGVTIKTSSDRVTQYTSRIKRKAIEENKGLPSSCDYTLFEKIGEGGMGVIYLAGQASLGRNVALKMTKESGQMTDAMMENFLTEALVTGDFDHPNVVPIHDAGIDFRGQLFYVMKRVQGVTWDSLLHPKTDEDKKVAATYALTDHLNILNSVCNAVAFAHSRNVIHRDLKPANVMIGKFGEVLVLDWGLAAGVGPNDKAATLQELNSFGGTVVYMAPEMARVQKGQIGKHSDIYLLGALLYEILTGHPPHSGNTFKEALVNAMLNRIEPPDKENDIDIILMETALKAMSTKPLQRFFTVANFQRPIKRYLQGKASHLKSVQLSRRGTDFLRRGVETTEVKSIMRSCILFERALRMWSGNREAELGYPRAEHALMRSITESGQIDLMISFLKEKNLLHDLNLQAEKQNYIVFRQNHPVISFIFSRALVYRALKGLDRALVATLRVMNFTLKLMFISLILVLPLVMYWAQAPMSYIVSFTAVFVFALTIGELFWRKLVRRKKTPDPVKI